MYHSLKNRRETHMMGTEDDTASEEGTTQVCSRSHVNAQQKRGCPVPFCCVR